MKMLLCDLTSRSFIEVIIHATPISSLHSKSRSAQNLGHGRTSLCLLSARMSDVEVPGCCSGLRSFQSPGADLRRMQDLTTDDEFQSEQAKSYSMDIQLFLWWGSLIVDWGAM